jgi:hypothetical protein
MISRFHKTSLPYFIFCNQTTCNNEVTRLVRCCNYVATEVVLFGKLGRNEVFVIGPD